MRFKVTFKDPDALCECINDEAKRLAEMIEGIDDDERESIAEVKAEKMRFVAGAYFKYGEYVTIEIDTEAQTATVVHDET